jgi:hypothetical protein
LRKIMGPENEDCSLRKWEAEIRGETTGVESHLPPHLGEKRRGEDEGVQPENLREGT